MQMLKTATFALTAVMAMSAMAADQFGVWAKTIRDKQSWQTGRLPAIADGYKRRMDADGSDYEARVLHAATILANLGENKNVAAYAKKFGFTLDYFGMKVNGSGSAPSAWPKVNDMVDTFVKEGVPVLKDALADLEGIPSDWKGSVQISAVDFPVDEDVYVDIGDVLYARAGIEAAIGLAYFAHGYDLTVDYAKGKAAVESRRTIQALPRAPESEWDEIWESASAGAECEGSLHSFKVGYVGKKMYIRVDGDMEGIIEDGDHAIRSIYLSMENSSEELWGLLLTDDPDGHMQQEGQYTARVFNTSESDTWWYWDFSKKTVPVKMTQSDGACQFEIDLSKFTAYAKAGAWSINWGEVCLYTEWIYEPFYDDYFDEYYAGYWWCEWDGIDSVDDFPAKLYRLFTEQTKFMAKVRNQSSLTQSKSWMKMAMNRALMADAAVLARTDQDMHFVEYDPIDADAIDRARNLTEKALASLDVVQEIDVLNDFEYYGNFDLTLLPNDGVMQVYLGALFEGRITRDLLPTLLKDANEGPVPVVETIADPTLAGLLPEFTAKTWSHILQDRGISVAHQTVTLKLDTNGGKLPKGAPAAVSLYFDEDSEECYYPELPVPERAGFIFTGWAAAKSGGEAVHDGDAYDASLFVGAKTPTLYAQWLQLYALTVKGEAASASWDWSDEQRKALPDAALEGDFERVLDGKGVVNVPAGANVWIYAADGTEGRGDKWLTFQKWTPSSAKANLGASFKVGESETQFVMPAEKLTMTATYIDEATCGWLTAEAWANEVNVGWSDELGDDVYINPPYEAFEWSPDGKTWYKSGDSALLKAGSYTVSWRSTDPRWSPPSLKEKVKVEAGDEVSPMSDSFFFTYVPQVVVDVMTFENGELRKSSAGGTVAMNPKDGLVPTDKTVALTAKANKNYAFQGWALAKYWEYGDSFKNTDATWKLENYTNGGMCGDGESYLNNYIDPTDKKVHVVAVFKALSAYSEDDISFDGFGGSDTYNEADDGTVTIKAVVGCALDDDFALVCGPLASPLAYKLNGKLPDGLKFDAKKGVLSGAPKKAGNASVTITATDPAKNAKILTVNFIVNSLPDWLVGEFRGIMSEEKYVPGYWDWDDETQEEHWVAGYYLPSQQNGILELSVKSDGKVSAKLLTSVGSRSVSGTLSWFPDEDDSEAEGTFTFTAKMTKDDEECDVEFYPDGTIGGYADSYSKSEGAYFGGDMTGMRQDTALLAKSNFLDKYYTFAFCATTKESGERWDDDLQDWVIDESEMKSGYGYLTLKTDKKGVAKVTGQLPDGEKVSMSALVLPESYSEGGVPVADDISARIYVFASPSSYKKQDWFAMTLMLDPLGSVWTVDGAAWTAASPKVSGGSLCAPESDSSRNAVVYGDGALYSEAKSLENHYWMAYCEYNENVQLEYTCKATYKEGGKTYTDTWPETASARGFSSEFLDNDCFFCVAVQGDAKGAISLKEKSPAPWARAYKEGGQSFMEWEYSKDKNGKEITDPSQLSISFAKATGIFTGKAKVYFDYEVCNYKNGEEIWTKQHKDATLPYSGVMIYDGDGDYYGYGSAVHTYKYSYSDESGKTKTDTKKVTLPVSLEPADGE